MITSKQIQKELNKIYPEIKFYTGDGYFYLMGRAEGIDTAMFPAASIYVCRLKHQSFERWIQDALNLIREGIAYNKKYG